MFELKSFQSPTIEIFDPIWNQKNIELFIKCDYLNHPTIMGNKFWKLKHNLLQAKALGYNKILTFGGAFSNHIYATASAGLAFGFETIGIIRGNELNPNSNKTLAYAQQSGMKLIFVDRNEYSNKLELAHQYGQNCYIIPEGGTNNLAIGGVEELKNEIIEEINPNYIITAMGTGGTFLGLKPKEKETHQTIGIPVLKGFSQIEIENQIIPLDEVDYWPEFHFGGYGKTTLELLNFMTNFELKHQIPLEQVYTAKALWGLLQKIEQNYFKPNTKIVFVHTGGLQGKS